MTTYTKAPVTSWASVTTDAIFREWGKAISDGMAAVGMVQTADTGQINWATVAKPTGANVMMGYEIWRFNDTMQGTKPLYLKLEYGAGAVASYPGMLVTLGSTSDGAGVVSGTYSSKQLSLLSAAAAAGSLPILVSGGDGWLQVAFMISASNMGVGFAVERLLDVNGDPSDRGVIFHGIRGSGNPVYWIFGTTWNAADGGGIPSAWPKQTNDSDNVKTGDYVLFAGSTPVSNATPGADSLWALPYEQTLLHGMAHNTMGSHGSTITVTRWDGVAHTYMCTGRPSMDVASNPKIHMYFRWE